jgi:hypothetical protein
MQGCAHFSSDLPHPFFEQLEQAGNCFAAGADPLDGLDAAVLKFKDGFDIQSSS